MKAREVIRQCRIEENPFLFAWLVLCAVALITYAVSPLLV